MDEDFKAVDIIIGYAESNFLDGKTSVQVNNFKNLIKFMSSNNIPFTLESEDYEKLLSNSKISTMLSSILSLSDNKVYLKNTLFYALAILYANNNGIKLNMSDEDDEEDEDDYIEEKNNYSDSQYQTYFNADIVRDYLRQLVYDPFTPEEEKEIFKRYSNGEKQLKETIFKHNLRLVVSVAKRYIGSGVDFIDLIQDGNLGLDTAIDRFDYKTGNKFSTYAIWWIKQSIVRSISNTSRMIRVPVDIYDKYYKVNKFVRKYTFENFGAIPTPEEISQALELPLDKVKTILQISTTVSLNTPVGENGDKDTELAEFIEDPNSGSPEDDIFYEEFRNAVFNSDILKPKEKEVLMYRFGFKDGRRYRLEEVGKVFNVTRERIRQIEAKALRKLRTNVSLRQFNSRFDDKGKKLS